MKLISQDEAASLKAGQRVNVYWFSPRAPKGDSVPTREYGGRTEYLESVWKDCVVKDEPYMSASDGWLVLLEGKGNAFCASRMELV